MKKTFLISLFAFVLVFSCIGLSASITTAQTLDAQGFVNADTANGQGAAAIPDFQPLTKVRGTPFESVFGNNATLGGFFQTLFTLSITIGALLAVLMLAWSGYQYLLTDVAGIKVDAKQRIQNALIGLLMLLATVLILRQINPDIVSLRILTNTGTAVVPTQQTTPTNDGMTSTNTPNGYCLIVNQSSPTYVCYNSEQACAVNGPDRCAPYSNGQPVLTNGPIDSWNIRWSNADPGLNICPTNGEGWQSLPPIYCSATVNNVAGQCCGLSKTYDPPAVYDSSGGRVYTKAQEPYIKSGQWCVAKNDGYVCYASANICNTAKTGTTNCLLRTADQGWESNVTTGAQNETQYSTSDLTAIPDNRYCYRSPTTAFCTTTENQCGINEGLYRKNNPTVTVQKCALFSK